MSKPKLKVIKVYVSEDTKKRAEAKYGSRCVSYAVNKLVQKDLKEKP
jgi:hypothetical protein